MLRVQSFRAFTGEERGVAMVEFALIAPLLVLLLIGTYDLGNAINQYMALSRIAYEGTRYAATLPGLADTNVLGNDGGNHHKIKDRVNELLDRGGFRENRPTVVTENQDNEWVVVTISRTYESVFGIYRGLPITVSATGPYLGNR